MYDYRTYHLSNHFEEGLEQVNEGKSERILVLINELMILSSDKMSKTAECYKRVS